MGRYLRNGNITLLMSALIENELNETSTDVASVSHPSLNYQKDFENGIEYNQADRGWQIVNKTLVSGASDVYDLYDMAEVDIGAGEGKDGLGQDVIFEQIAAIAIVNENDPETEEGLLEVEPDSTGGWGAIGIHTKANGGALRGGGILFKCNPGYPGFEIEDGLSHRIKLTAVDGDVKYSMYILARHDSEVSSSSSSISSSSSSSSSSVSSSSSSSS